MSKDNLPSRSSNAEVADFLQKVAATPMVARDGGRLIFALDATASRQPTWDRACQLQGEMFLATESLGGLTLQLVWYRGMGEFNASKWLTKTSDAVRYMTGVCCRGGLTQIREVLLHAIGESRAHRINALVFVGDCVEEDVDELFRLAGQLGLLGVPAFLFHEGGDAVAGQALRRIADLTRGAYCQFDSGSARQLKELLNAVAVYAAGGRRALEELSRHEGGLADKLTFQLRKD